MATNTNQRRSASAARQREARKKRKIIIFTIEIIVILAMVAVLYLVMSQTEESEGPKRVDLVEEELAIPEKVIQEKEEGGTMKGYMNIALFGLDAGSDVLDPDKKYSDETLEKLLYKGSRSDTIMIASVNLDTGDIRLVSVYRDTYMNIGTDEYKKCNAAYSEGGAEQAIKMLNMNLDMDIKDFVSVGFRGVVEVVDGLGGVYIDVDEEELKYINNYQISLAELLKCDYQAVTQPGLQLLDGIQATAYCRIRQTAGSDFKRASRQREVLKAIEAEAKKKDYETLTKVFNEVIDDVYTNLKGEDILALIKNIANYQIVDEGGFPQDNLRTSVNMGAKGICEIPMNLEKNVVWLHQFLFEDANYVVTDSVLEYDRAIQKNATPYLNKSN